MRWCLIVLLMVVLSGCSTVKRLKVLKNVSNEQKQNQLVIDQQDAQFKQLLELAKVNQLVDYKTAQMIKNHFGEPILVKSVQVNGQEQQQWLYRYSTKYFDSPKVYLYFDQQQDFLTFEVVDPK